MQIKNKILKSILAVTMLTLSPFLTIALVGTIYVIFQMIRGMAFRAGVQAFVNIISHLAPYFIYLTSIPVILVVVTLLAKYLSSVKRIKRAKSTPGY